MAAADMTHTSAIHLAVVIPTRNRPEDIQRCLESLTAVEYADWELVVVDQSTDEQTATIARAVAGRLPQLTYRHTDRPGVARARNFGVSLTRGEWIVFVDDDCTVAPDWLERMAAMFARHPEVSIVFGTVNAAPHDWRTEFIPVIAWEREWVVRGRRALRYWRGLGACMAVRRDTFERVGGFDLHFGPGSGYFESAEEAEFMARAVRLGAAVLRTPAISVVHHGARAYANGSYQRLLRHSLRSRGAVDLNLIWSGEPVAPIITLMHFWETIRIIRPLNLLTRRGPTHLSWPLFYLQGFLLNLWLHLRPYEYVA